MRWDNIHFAACERALGAPVPIKRAIAARQYSARAASRTGQRAVTVAADDQAAADFAVAAAREALSASGHTPADLAVVLHAVVLDAGHDAWNSAAYVARQVGLPHSPALVSEIRSGCAGALIGVQLACAYLETHPHAAPAALVTAADCWPAPGVDRYTTDPALVLGDGGAAVVLSRKRGFARLLAVSTSIDPQLEQLDRGDEPFGPFQHGPQAPLRIAERARPALERLSKEEMHRSRAAVLQDAVQTVLTDAGLVLSDVTHVVLPFIGRHHLVHDLAQLGFNLQASSFAFSRDVGHLGAADPLAGLSYLRSSRRLASGDVALLIAHGGGHVCSALLLEAVEPRKTATR